MVARQVMRIGIAKEQPDPRAVLADGEPGDYAYSADESGAIAGLQLICPARRLHGITFGSAHWQWDGNRERPTVTPSIKSAGHCCAMHVNMTDGQWVLHSDHRVERT